MDSITIAWIVIPTLLGSLIYLGLAICAWPYARPLFPLWLFLFALFFPPLFPFLLVYTIVITCFFAPVVVLTEPAVARPPVVLVVGQSNRGLVRSSARGTTAKEPDRDGKNKAVEVRPVSETRVLFNSGRI